MANQTTEHIKELCKGPETINIMEVCGTHTVSIMRNGIRSLLPDSIRLISGPGCPVCVTTQGYIDAAIDLARRENIMLCTYGDMMKVPGKDISLDQQRANGADIQVIYSALDAIKFAQQNPQKEIVFAAVGFETTTPITAAAILQARELGLKNFTILAGHKLAIPVIELVAQGDAVIDAFLCPGHVSVIIGSDAYIDIATKYRKPCVVASFEPQQILNAIAKTVEMIVNGQIGVHNEYKAAVTAKGNIHAQELTARVFDICDVNWRSIGLVKNSGLRLADEFSSFDAVTKFNLSDIEKDYSMGGCKCGQVIQGMMDPNQCPHFGNKCLPQSPLGPCMVSSEGTCAAWYKYHPLD
ncbi:MAG: hydrogenase formation protein HypD [Phycisphaerae bacterium]|nr:hydrogenase formation protein HypD [Phycisphaerae bacterium]